MLFQSVALPMRFWKKASQSKGVNMDLSQIMNIRTVDGTTLNIDSSCTVGVFIS